MVEILEIPEVRARVSPLSVDEYHRLGEFNERGRRTELIRGIVIEKMSKSPLHSSISTRLFVKVLGMLPGGHIVRQEQLLTFADSEPEPDVAVVAAPPGEDFSAAHPRTAELVIEVSVSSAALDRANASLYAEAGVKEYWIVLAASRTIDVYRHPETGVYRSLQTYRTGEELVSASVPAVRLTVDEVFRVTAD
jgi:Uma2 family endonuclease